MNKNYIYPNYIISLTDNYQFTENGITANAVNYIGGLIENSIFKKNLSEPQQGGGLLRKTLKFFSGGAVGLMKKKKWNIFSIFSYLNKIRNKAINTNQEGGAIQKEVKETPVEILEDKSGSKYKTRLVFLANIKNTHVIIKIMPDKRNYEIEKDIYQFFTKTAKKDKLVNKRVVKSYDSEKYVKEITTNKDHYLLLRINMNNSEFNLRLDNSVISSNKNFIPFLNEPSEVSNSFNWYTDTKSNKETSLFETIKQKSKTGFSLYLITEIREDYTMLYDFFEDTKQMTDKNRKKLLASIIDKLVYTSDYLRKYTFNHFDLHSKNVLINTRKKEVLYFDFDFSVLNNVVKFEDSIAYRLIFQLQSTNSINLYNFLKQNKEQTKITDQVIQQYSILKYFQNDIKVKEITNDYILNMNRLDLGYVYDLLRVCNWLKNTNQVNYTDDIIVKSPEIFREIYNFIILFPVGTPSDKWREKALVTISLVEYLTSKKIL